MTVGAFAGERDEQVSRLDQAGISEEEFLEKFDIPELAALPFSKVNPALHWISGVAA